MTRPVLIACSHGTSSLDGRDAIRALVDEVRVLLPGVEVREAFVDVQEPSVDDVVTDLPPGRRAVIVPLLLSTGFHTGIDIARAARLRDGVVAAPPLGPHDLLALVLESRLGELGLRDDDAIVLAAAGSSDPRAADDVGAVAELLSRCVSGPVTVGFAAGCEPRIDEAVTAARSAGASRVVAASYVLAPGYFAEVIRRSGADAATSPLGPDPRIAAIVAERYRAAAAILVGAA